MTKEHLNPGHIMETATAFWASKVLLTAVGLDLFTKLGDGKMTALELGESLELHPRGTYDFFDALVALKFLNRDGDGPEGKYRNTPETASFLNKTSPMYIGGLPQMLNARLFGFWNDLGVALKTGQPQNELRHGGKSMFEELYSSQVGLSNFLDAMAGLQAANFTLLADKFDFSRYKTVSDIGGALALLSRTVGTRHRHLTFNCSRDASRAKYCPSLSASSGASRSAPGCRGRHDQAYQGDRGGFLQRRTAQSGCRK